VIQHWEQLAPGVVGTAREFSEKERELELLALCETRVR